MKSLRFTTALALRGGKEKRLVTGEASHEPLMSGFAAFLLDSPALLVDFKKSAMMAIDLGGFGPQPHGVLAWYLTPKLAK